MSPTPTLGFGAYTFDGGVDHFALLNSWLGRSISSEIYYINSSSFAQARVDVAAPAIATIAARTTIHWAMMLTAPGVTLASVAGGSNDADFTFCATKQAAAQPAGSIYIRLGWEMNGSFFPWAAFGNEAAYIAAFQRVVGLYRAVSSRFLFIFCPNQSVGGGSGLGGYVNPETMYPGDAYVDIMAMDSYYQTAFDSSDGPTAFNAKVNTFYGWSWMTDFARKHQKLIAMGEWGVNYNNSTTAAYINLVAQFFRQQGFLYHDYWDSTDGINSQLSNGQFPLAGAQFIAEFSKSF